MQNQLWIQQLGEIQRREKAWRRPTTAPTLPTAHGSLCARNGKGEGKSVPPKRGGKRVAKLGISSEAESFTADHGRGITGGNLEPL